MVARTAAAAAAGQTLGAGCGCGGRRVSGGSSAVGSQRAAASHRRSPVRPPQLALLKSRAFSWDHTHRAGNVLLHGMAEGNLHRRNNGSNTMIEGLVGG